MSKSQGQEPLTGYPILISRPWLPWCKERLAQIEARGVRTDMGRCYVAMLRDAIRVAERRLAAHERDPAV